MATKTPERAIDALANVSVVRQEQIDRSTPSRISDIFNGMPSVWFAVRPDTPGSSINVRGLQDFGRVEVLVDGAQQDFQRSGHFANGQFYLDPELLAGADVVRGPVANIYGSVGIGGVASYRTKDLDDILRPGETAAIQSHGMFGTNGDQWLASTFGGARTSFGDVFLGGVFRDSGDAEFGHGTIRRESHTSLVDCRARRGRHGATRGHFRRLPRWTSPNPVNRRIASARVGRSGSPPVSRPDERAHGASPQPARF